MGQRQKDFDTAILTGMVKALDIVREHGIQGLEKDILARKRTKIKPPMYFYDLDKCTDDIKAWSIRRAAILFVAALHDEFGFGVTRQKRMLLKVAEASRLLQTGEAGWWDYSKSIEDDLGLRIFETKEGGIRVEEIEHGTVTK